jgi:hypothetical protein
MNPTKFILIVLAALASLHSADAWSSRSGQTYYDINRLAGCVEVYRLESGQLPSGTIWWKELQISHLRVSDDNEAPKDQWGHPIAYRVPGKYGAFDLYSIGPDGIDHDGKRDDVSLWADVNDGYHWKSTWPAGRFSIWFGFVLGVGVLFFRRILPWKVVVPLAGSVVSAGVTIGCQLLKHPGIVPSRNEPLDFKSAIALSVLILSLAILAKNLQRSKGTSL